MIGKYDYDHKEITAACSDNANTTDRVHDFRFRALLPKTDWDRLPAQVRTRFSKRLSEGRAAIYAGYITETRFSAAGWIMAQALRIMGAPLPLSRDTGCPAIVNVTEDPEFGGQLWTRVYHRKHGFPQTINSAKRFAGSTRLEEHIGFGFGMALKVTADESGLTFESDHYFWNFKNQRLRLPRWLTAWQTEVRHIDRGGGAFDFTLRLTHPFLGELIYQEARFHDQ
jgi:hypothetical protein